MRDWIKSKNGMIAGAASFFGVLFFLWQILGVSSPSAVRVLDARISFQFTAYQEKEEHFISYSLENTKKRKVKASVRVQLGALGIGGLFQPLKDARDTAVLEPLETKSFVTKFELPKGKVPQGKELIAQVKVKRVSRA
jgi:hypothetical protein